jgi:hypothetical protein
MSEAFSDIISYFKGGKKWHGTQELFVNNCAVVNSKTAGGIGERILE